MGLFDVFKKQSPAPAAPKITEYSYTTAKHFRGFHRLAMVVLGDTEAMDNQEKFRGRDVTGLPIVFKDYGQGAAVILDGLKIGTLYDSSLETLRSGSITDVYVKFDEETIVGKEEVEKRFRAFLIVKEK